MSGRSYDYAYSRVMDMADSLQKEGCCDCAEPALRELFREHLRKVARAMKAIEWNDSCDGDRQEAELIKACLALTPGQLEGEIAIRQVAAIEELLRSP